MADITPADKPVAESEQQRRERAADIAYAKGQRDAHVDSRLQSHELRLNAINGSIDRHARQAGQLRESIDDLRDKIDDMAASLSTRAAIEADRVKQIKTANERQISNRTFWLGVAAIVAALLAAWLSSHGGVF